MLFMLRSLRHLCPDPYHPPLSLKDFSVSLILSLKERLAEILKGGGQHAATGVTRDRVTPHIYACDDNVWAPREWTASHVFLFAHGAHATRKRLLGKRNPFCQTHSPKNRQRENAVGNHE